jgi:hypothetical protein
VGLGVPEEPAFLVAEKVQRVRPGQEVIANRTTGDADTKPEPDEPTTPAASASNSSHDLEWRLCWSNRT